MPWRVAAATIAGFRAVTAHIGRSDKGQGPGGLACGSASPSSGCPGGGRGILRFSAYDLAKALLRLRTELVLLHFVTHPTTYRARNAVLAYAGLRSHPHFITENVRYAVIICVPRKRIGIPPALSCQSASPIDAR
jgi:hypothetical protein